KYRMEGLDADWVDAGGQRVAVYPHLPPGHYRFRVSGCNNDGFWNEAGAGLGLRVLPPFWRTWWFSALAAGTILGGAGAAVRQWSLGKLRRKLERIEREHELEKERARIAQDLHDELGA